MFTRVYCEKSAMDVACLFLSTQKEMVRQYPMEELIDDVRYLHFSVYKQISVPCVESSSMNPSG